jgi:high-affinity iron transporter
MEQAFMLTLADGCEAFVMVALSVAYLRRTNRGSLIRAVYWGIFTSLPGSIAVAQLFHRASNHALWEGSFTDCAALLAIWLATDLWQTVTERHDWYDRFVHD